MTSAQAGQGSVGEEVDEKMASIMEGQDPYFIPEGAENLVVGDVIKDDEDDDADGGGDKDAGGKDSGDSIVSMLQRAVGDDRASL